MTGKRSVLSRRAKTPDDAPELTAEWFAQADLYQGDRLIRRGRPKGSGKRELISLRLDKEALAAYRATGANWQRRINDAVVQGAKALRKRA